MKKCIQVVLLPVIVIAVFSKSWFVKREKVVRFLRRTSNLLMMQ